MNASSVVISKLMVIGKFTQQTNLCGIICMLHLN